MKTAFKWLLAIILVLLLLSLWWLRDEPLDKQAQQWLQPASEGPSSLAYLRLLGISAPAGESVEAYAQAWLTQHQHWRASHTYQQSMPAPERSIALPPEALCHLGSFACLEQLRQQPVDRWLSQYAELRQRYLNLLSEDDYRTLSMPSLDEPMPDYRALERANRVLALEALQLAEQGAPGQALAVQEQKIVQLRRLLAQADNLILKMLIVRLISNDLETLALLHQAGLIGPPDVQEPLTAAERSLAAPMRHEFALIGSGLASILPESATEHGVPAWQLRWLFKPNMTLNESVQSFVQAAFWAELPLAQFVALPDQAEMDAGFWQRWKNPIGHILAQVAGPDFRVYIRQLHDLDSKIALFNQLAKDQPEQAQWDVGQQRYCAQGLWPDERQLRCLPWRAPQTNSVSSSL